MTSRVGEVEEEEDKNLKEMQRLSNINKQGKESKAIAGDVSWIERLQSKIKEKFKPGADAEMENAEQDPEPAQL